MRYAILIINHVSPKQTRRLIERLNNDYFDFYLHIDKNTDIKPYQELKQLHNVFFIKKRVNVKPGGYSALKTNMTGLTQIIKSGIKYHSVTLLNGSDYPTKRADEICEFLNAHKGNQFIAYDEEWSKDIEDKTNKYFLTDYNIPCKAFLERFLNSFLNKTPLPKNLNVVGKSAYWTITLNCAQYILAYIQRNRLYSSLKFVHDSDKFIFQSIIMSSPYRDEAINNNYHYSDCSTCTAERKTLTVKDFNKIIFSDSIFAGHFNVDVDKEILDMIDRANEIKITYSAE
ncbi:beta-1,6-N-acetylglucosaminyltransferase [Mucilaginibacter agri]|uniref:Peptide O-xylosyltransferase n=1 Tax=Mucilaginibacter agri TaxID=2695265 RepID=A0A966DRQ1_9SPHI|nr:beta-1,6-N-acetylglucosaminyltransferase [Mucilaginibacter agri]NCD68725.1 hypothetical protein [Mucilaginibacter agri]